jgi:alcohol dehydrogenase
MATVQAARADAAIPNLPVRTERMADIAFALNAGDTHADAGRNAGAAVGAVTALRDQVGLNRLISEFGITEDDFGQIAADALDDEVLTGAPRQPAEADIGAILLASASQRGPGK